VAKAMTRQRWAESDRFWRSYIFMEWKGPAQHSAKNRPPKIFMIRVNGARTMLHWPMRVAKLIPIVLVALTATGFALGRSAPLDPIAGFELRLLDKKFPVEITAGGKTEVHGVPVWVFMPEAGQAQAPLEDITQPADLDDGTTLLPAPPDGFGLRALKLPIRESFILADGRQAIVEIPVFVYFRRVEVPTRLSTLP
jgi:hypothetical protein